MFTNLLSTANGKSINKIYKYVIHFRPTNQPSCNLTSKTRIEKINLTTYISGALGSWIGFSFAGINPVPFFAQVKDVTRKLLSKLGHRH